MPDNFWSLLIKGLISIAKAGLAGLPRSSINPVLAVAAETLFFAITPILFFVGPFINLQLFASVITTILTLEGVRGIISIYRFILKLVPAAN